jgi:hypothetical protein
MTTKEMTMQQPRRFDRQSKWRSAFAATLALLLSACGSVKQSDRSADESIEDLPQPNALIVAMFGQPDKWAVQMDEVARQIADCMHDRGWNDFKAIPGAFQLVQPEAERDYFNEHGFGVSTDIGSDVVAMAPDPNDTMIADLDPASRDHFYSALWEPAEAPQPGCMFEGHQEVFGSMAAFGAEYKHLTERARAETIADKRYLTAQDAWSTCMSVAGFEYRDEPALIDDLLRQLRTIAGDGSPEDIPESDAQLRRLQQLELQTAEAAKRCRTESRILDVYNEIFDENVLARAEECPACFS